MSTLYIDGMPVDTTRTIRVRFEADLLRSGKPVELEATYSQLQAMVVELQSAAETLLRSP